MAAKGDFSEWTLADVERVNKARAVPPSQRSPIAAPQQADTSESAKPSKHRNIKELRDGFLFDSGHEADVWMFLKARQAAGEISGLQRQVPFPLFAPVLNASREPVAVLEVCEYYADFVWYENEGRIVADAKPPKHVKRPQPYPLKKKWLELQEGIAILEL